MDQARVFACACGVMGLTEAEASRHSRAHGNGQSEEPIVTSPAPDAAPDAPPVYSGDVLDPVDRAVVALERIATALETVIERGGGPWWRQARKEH